MARPTDEDRIRAALWFAEHGFGVFPVWSTRDDGSCRCPAGAACKPAGKHPITANGFQDATREPERIRTFLSAASHPNYGLVCPDGVFVWDVDGDGPARLLELEARYGALPPTLRTDTANGQHVFLRWPDAHPRPLKQMFGYITRWGSGAAAGYVIGPRSVHRSGKVYTPAAGATADIAVLPETWARAAVEPDHSTIVITGPRPAEEVQVGGRHDWLRDRARFYAGTIRDPQVLRAAVMAENERLSVPKTPEEVDRAIGDALTKFPADPVEQDPETGEEHPVYGEAVGLLPLRSDDDLFPAAVPRVAFSGLLGECVDAVLPGTDASDVGILTSLIAFCGVLMPATGYFQGNQTSSPFIAIVGTTGDGRKGTAMNRAKDALSLVIQANKVNEVLLDGVNSGEGLIKAISDRREPVTGLLFEEEYANLLASQGREGSTLDSKMRVAFDGRQLSNRKVKDSDSVNGYWLAGLISVTPDELRSKVPKNFMKSGSGNRWLWVPVRRRPVVSKNTPPALPEGLAFRLLDAYRENGRRPPELETDDKVSDLLAEYDEFLRAGAVGTAFDMTRRYAAIAYRIALVHAAAERSETVTKEHAYRALALTEYARAGLEWVFGKSVGDEDTTLLARHLEAEGTLSNAIISKYLIRIPSRRQAATDELQRLGIARVRQVGTKGRKRTELVWVDRPKANFRDFSTLFGGYREQAPAPPSVDKRAEGAQKARESRAEGAQKSAEVDVVDTMTGEVERQSETIWSSECSDIPGHADHHRNTPNGWVCVDCNKALCWRCGAGPFLSQDFHDRHVEKEHPPRAPRRR
ncbi:MAG: bifunctional DNA primase/polymerase [Chloroflexi bacterium]|nr:bifunctional DNA primase/polymerase [Chloroflexota bacterium]